MPMFMDKGSLKQFDVVVANPLFNQAVNRPNGHPTNGVKQIRSQGNADYAFFQHILTSMKPKSGRSAILYPHGILFRQQEKSIRKQILSSDLIECIIGLGPNLFYNSSMHSCIVICRNNKPVERKNKILFIDAKDELIEETDTSYLDKHHIEKIKDRYFNWKDISGFSRIVDIHEVEEMIGVFQFLCMLEMKVKHLLQKKS